MAVPSSASDLVPVRQVTAQDVLREARSWINTPYKHQARLKGVGVDCLGFLVGMFEWLYGFVPEDDLPNYSPHWAELRRHEEPLLRAAEKWLSFPATGALKPLPADILLFRVRNQSAVKHCAIMNTNGEIIHSYDRHHVLSSAPDPVWFRPHRMHVFCWPGVARWQQ